MGSSARPPALRLSILRLSILRRTSHHPVLRSFAFALVFAGAVLLGRTTIMDGTSLSLVWPAAGVAAAWFAVQRDAGTRWIDAALLALITWSLNLATGAGVLLALFFVAANLLQAEVFVHLLRRWTPHLWGAGGQEPLTGTRTLARVLAAALTATAAGALVGPTAAALAAGSWSWLTVAVWMVRNSVAIALITVMVLRVGHLLTLHRSRRRQADDGAEVGADAANNPSPRQLPFLLPTGWRALELAAAVTASALAYLGVFWFAHGLPLAFMPLALTVWIALRFDTTLVALHDFLISCAAVLLTLAGGGPFAAIADDATRALVVQAYVGLLAVIGLTLALGRDEREVLMGQLRTSQAHAVDLLAQVRLRAEFSDTVLATVDVGVAVCDARGRITLLNDTARTWHGLDANQPLDFISDCATASPLAALQAENSPLQRALRHDATTSAGSAGSAGSAATGAGILGVELLIAPPGLPAVPVTCSARPLNAPDGTVLGAVLAMHDLRSLRAREDALAAANAQLREQAENLERLVAASRDVLTSPDPRRAVCEAARDISGGWSAMLWQPDGAKRQFVATGHVDASTTASAAEDVSGRELQRATSEAMTLDLYGATSLVHACYYSGQPIFLADAARHPQANPAIAATMGEASGAWIPVPGRDGVIAGVLVVLWRERLAALPPATSALLTALASEAAHAFDRADLVDRLAHTAVHDPLTGLANRRRWDEAAGIEIARAARTGAPLTFALIDLDHFKAYNDTRGHLAGDELLRAFAGRAPVHLRDLDVLARWGGEEFALALPGCTAEQARVVVDRIRADVPDGQTCSIGVSQWRAALSAEQVMAEADEALYRAKGEGRNRTVLAGAVAQAMGMGMGTATAMTTATAATTAHDLQDAAPQDATPQGAAPTPALKVATG